MYPQNAISATGVQANFVSSLIYMLLMYKSARKCTCMLLMYKSASKCRARRRPAHVVVDQVSIVKPGVRGLPARVSSKRWRGRRVGGGVDQCRIGITRTKQRWNRYFSCGSGQFDANRAVDLTRGDGPYAGWRIELALEGAI